MEILLFSILLCNWNNTAMQYSLCEIDGICTVAYALKSNHTKNHPHKKPPYPILFYWIWWLLQYMINPILSNIQNPSVMAF